MELNIFMGRLTTPLEYHKGMATIYEQYDDGLVTMEEANICAYVTCGSHSEISSEAMDLYERVKICEVSLDDKVRNIIRDTVRDHGYNKVKCIKEVRSVTGMSLKEAKEISERLVKGVTGYESWEDGRTSV